ncbi:uncharacterized protein K489DRAFT_247652 [Dissoconium aciculare CBS 342.82]|uniref:Uncharacterized protein n=1 Tax=Dissoconium aciculare CBS 342.82 TaxID=1314786 RepID=A0A6J3M3A9_9PEZI|nr:uncharacterized protein K489DRAFT_247652 [Dissoconium aciculare CBS 342.82]KAF1821412.1 hypothetical protein K489DRAFT_247652 [Dissoconium aciculare CBS 342.82]
MYIKMTVHGPSPKYGLQFHLSLVISFNCFIFHSILFHLAQMLSYSLPPRLTQVPSTKACCIDKNM